MQKGYLSYIITYTSNIDEDFDEDFSRKNTYNLTNFR